MNIRSHTVGYGEKEPFFLGEWLLIIQVALALVAAISIYAGLKILWELPADLRDGGIHTFTATESGPTQIGKGRHARTVIAIQYRTSVDGKVYAYIDREGNTREDGDRAVREQIPVERRILFYDQGLYFTVEPTLSLQEYQQRRQLRAALLIGGGLVYLTLASLHLWRRIQARRFSEE